MRYDECQHGTMATRCALCRHEELRWVDPTHRANPHITRLPRPCCPPTPPDRRA